MKETELAEGRVGELVAADYRLASAFKRYGIDFCCGGGRTVRAAAEAKGIDLAELTQALQAATAERPDDASRAATWELDFLADYIEQVHHRYVRESIPHLSEFTRKVARVHGAANPETVEIAALFEEVAAELLAHLEKEEQILFPYVRALAVARRQGEQAPAPAFGSAQNPIRVMMAEHEAAGALMRRIGEQSGEFTPPEHACNTYRVAYAKLREFEDDLHRHVHLENNVLFPRALALEAA